MADAGHIIGYKALVTARPSKQRNYRVFDIPELPPAAYTQSLVANAQDFVVDANAQCLDVDNNSEVIYRDRLTRTMHALNYLARGLEGDLHMSVNPQHLQAVHKNHGEVFEHILAQCGLQPDRIVLEIPEYAVSDKQHLRTAIAGWQQRRYRIAIDRFGAEHAQLTRVLDLKPNIIKFDSSFIVTLSASAATAKKLEAMIEQIIDKGIQVIATNIDDDTAYDAVRRYSLSALQGQWLTERPASNFLRTENVWAGGL